MPELLRTWTRYHWPGCVFGRRWGATPWKWAEGKTLSQVLGETRGQRGAVQPCGHCINLEERT